MKQFISKIINKFSNKSDDTSKPEDIYDDRVEAALRGLDKFAHTDLQIPKLYSCSTIPYDDEDECEYIDTEDLSCPPGIYEPDTSFFDFDYALDDKDPMKDAEDLIGTFVLVRKTRDGDILLSDHLYTSIKECVYIIREYLKNLHQPDVMSRADIITLETCIQNGDFEFILGHTFGDAMTKYQIKVLTVAKAVPIPIIME